MGQRHQAFIVARVVPHGSKDNKPFYRCIGAWHHQWCYGSLPLRAAQRFITLIKNPVNAAIIREELKSIQGKYGRHNEKPAIPVAPCPYSVFLLASAFNIALDERYTSGGPFNAGLLEAGMGCWDGDNNDGITIVDITDPTNPSYAFAMGPETYDKKLGDEPCTAREYLDGYYALDEEDDSEKGEDKAARVKEQRDLAARFDSIAFLTEDMLAEAWPTEFGPKKNLEHRRRATRTTKPNSAPTPQASETVKTVPPLADFVIEPAVARSLEHGTTDEIELLIPDKSAQIKSALRARKPFPDAGVPLLVAVMEHELKKEPGILDLSGFSLSAEQLVSVVQSFDDVTIVTLSNSHDLKIDHIRALLTAKPEIDRLDILDTSVTDKSLASLLTSEPKLFNRVSDIVHPLFLSGNPAANPGCFHIFASQPDSNVAFRSPSVNPAIPVWSPAKIVQNLVDVLKYLVDSEGRMITGQLQSMLIQTAMSAGLRKPVTPWRERPVTMLAPHVKRLHPDGWVFLFKQAGGASMGMFGGAQSQAGPRRNKYAFARVTNVGVQTYDLPGFLEEVKKEGRGPLPDAELVEQFQDLIIASSSEKKTDAASPDRNDPEAYPSMMSNALQSLFSRLGEGGLGATSQEEPNTPPLFDNDAASKYLVSFFTPQAPASGSYQIVQG